MRIFAASTALVTLVIGVGAGLAHPAAAAPTVDKVVIVTVPRLTWRAVADANPPNLMKLLRRSAVGSMSLRTVGARTTLGRGYATIGAGNRSTVYDVSAGLSLGAAAAYEGAPAAEVYRRRTDHPPHGRVLALGLAESERRNNRLLYGSELGSLGAALRRQGLSAAVVANADGDLDTARLPDIGFHREAALAVMDREGVVHGGTVGPSLLTDDPTRPYGRKLDAGATLAAFTAAYQSDDVVLLELSDLERADAYGDVATPTTRRAQRMAALADSDVILGRMLSTIDTARTVVMVVSPAAPRTGEQLGVFALAGPGIRPGAARSATTRRASYVTLPDVAPTVLGTFGAPVPDSMNGTAITSTGGSPPSMATARSLATDNVRTVFRDRATGPVSVVFVVFQVLVYAAGAAALTMRRPRATAVVAFLALMVLAMPLLGFVSGLVRYDRLGIGAYIGALLVGAGALATAAWSVGRRRMLLAPALLIGTTLTVLLVDVVRGGRLQIDTVFGYSPIVAGRFSGYGNLAYGLLAMSAIVTATTAWAIGGGRRGAAWLVAAILGLALIVDGAPPWGSDVGGVLASGPAFALVASLLAGRRIDWRRWVLVVGATLAALTAFALVDLARPPSSRTHLGRLVADPSKLGDTIQRKLLSNLHILTSSVWTLIIPVALAFLLFLALRPPGLLQAIQRKVPGLRACLLGGLLAGLLGFAVNDSGVAVPAMMLAVLLPYLTYLLMRTSLE